MNKVNNTLFQVHGDTQACVMSYKASNRQPKYFFGVFHLLYWLVLGKNKFSHTLFQVIDDTQACVMPYKSSNRQSTYLFGGF